MSKAERTRQFIVEKTAALFNTRGYAGTSLSDITDATGLTKGAVYGNFSDKEEVAIEAFRHNTGMLLDHMERILGSGRPAAEQLKDITSFYRKNWKRIFARGGCPLLNAATEADDHLPFLRKSVQDCFRSWSTQIEKIIREGMQSGIFCELDAREYAYTIIMLLEGGILLSKTMGTQRHLLSALDRIDRIIEEEMIC